MTVQPFTLTQPRAQTTCVIFASPHSGRDYPLAFLRESVLDERGVRSSEDAFVDLLFSSAPAMGAPLLAATAPRAFVDLNRGREELDPAMIEGVPRGGHNPRVSSGLGVIPRVVSNGRVIRSGKISRAEAERRLSQVWTPYHAQLHRLMDDTRARFGRAILIDCHSMPREALDSVKRAGGKRPEVVLGDRFGVAAGTDVMDRVEAAFSAHGFRVERNAPFAGAYITQTYGRPSRGRHAIQVEIDRSLYMDEARIRPSREFDSFRHVLNHVIADIVAIGRVDEVPVAAE